MSGIRCEVAGCRGNTPCPACLTGLTLAIRAGLIQEIVPRGASQSEEHIADMQRLVNHAMKSIGHELDRYWAKAVSGFLVPMTMPTNMKAVAITPGMKLSVSRKLKRRTTKRKSRG
jgi:hypothetical protein